ncbi:MAG: NAD(P)-dependent methylenetetrahydromethanopterin dehydrogenase [Methylococcales bacterium]
MPKKILYFITPGNNISPFDVTIAADAGFDMVVPFTNVQPESVCAMVQDAIFCRPPKRFNDTCVFIGGRDVHLATDMFQAAKKSMVGDFKVGVFADPNGAYTTSASIVALVEQLLNEHCGGGMNGRTLAVLGAGPVGLCTAILASQQGAKVKLCQLTADDDEKAAIRFCERYKAEVEWVSGQTQEEKIEALKDAEIVICAARAGIRVLNATELNHASKLLVAADTNAVPPTGIAGIGVQDMGVKVDFAGGSFLSIGPLAIGNLKYKVQFGLYQKAHQDFKAALIDFPDAYDFARSVLIERTSKKVA